MAADAEVKLNFAADINDAAKQLETLKELIELVAEDLSIIEGKSKAFGPFTPETIDMIRSMSEEVERMRAQYDTLQKQFASLQASHGTMSEHFLEELQAVQKALREQIEYTKEQGKQIKDLNALVEKQGEKIDELRKRNKRTTDDGIKGYTSLRTALTRFITQLTKGKVAIGELAVALKGLAYSSVILGAVQLAMDGIMWAWEGIKSMFTESKEEMQAAEEAAKRAQEELDKANKAAADAERKYKEFQEKIKNDESTARLKTQIEDIAAAYKKMRDEQEKIFGLAQLQAELEGRKVQDKAEQEMHEITLQRLELKRKKLLGEISESGYDKAAARLDLREKGIKNQSEVDKANLRVRQLEGELQAIRKEFAGLQIANLEEREAQAGRASSTALEGARLNLEKSISRRDAAFMEYKNTPYYGMNLPKFFTENKNWQDARWHEFVTAKKNWQDAQKGVKIAQSLYDKIKEQNEGYEEGEERIKQQVKRIGELSARFDKVEAQLKTAKSTAREIEDKTFIKSLRENEIADAENAVRTAEAVARKRKEAKKPAKVSGELKEAVKQIVKDAKTAYNTDGDRTDDVEVMRAVAELLRNNGSEMGGYKDGLKELLTVCSMLKVKGDSNSAELARLKTEIKSLKRRTSQQ